MLRLLERIYNDDGTNDPLFRSKQAMQPIAFAVLMAVLAIVISASQVRAATPYVDIVGAGAAAPILLSAAVVLLALGGLSCDVLFRRTERFVVVHWKWFGATVAQEMVPYDAIRIGIRAVESAGEGIGSVGPWLSFRIGRVIFALPPPGLSNSTPTPRPEMLHIWSEAEIAICKRELGIEQQPNKAPEPTS